MANTKDYSFREMVYDQCFSTGKEFTCKQLMDIVNKRLEERAMLPIQSRTTFMQDMQEMNSKFFRMYNKDCIVFEDRHKRRYYRYADGVESIYNRELTQEEVDNLMQVRNLLQGFKGMPQFGWIDQMMTRLDQNIIGKQKEVACFEGGTKKDKEYLMLLFNAIINRQVLDVKYWPHFQDSEDITLHPYYLKQYWRRWYLFAKREGGKDVEVFSLDCMESVKENKSIKYKGTKTSFKKYFKNMVGVTMPPEPTVEHIELWVDASLMPYLFAMPIHESQTLVPHDDSSCIISLDVMINYELVQELMFYADRLVVKSPAYFRDSMKERLEECRKSYENVEKDNPICEGLEPVLFSFNYIHETQDDWKDIHYRICLGLTVLDTFISDYSNDWGYIRSCLERIVNHSRTVIELNYEKEPTKIELKKYGDMVNVIVTPNSFVSKDQMPFSGFAKCKDVVRELYNGLLECAKAFPKDYVDGCPFTYDVVHNAIKSEIIENYLNEE